MLRVKFGETCAVETPRSERAYDAHCHLDRLWVTSYASEWDLEVLTRGATQRLVGVCASYCDPETWPSWEELEKLHPDVDVATLHLTSWYD